MCYEWRFWKKSATDKAQKQDELRPVVERRPAAQEVPPVKTPAQPARREEVRTEPETV